MPPRKPKENDELTQQIINKAKELNVLLNSTRLDAHQKQVVQNVNQGIDYFLKTLKG